MPRRKPVNPFYVLVLLSGGAFAVTACAYGVMTVRMLNPVEMLEAEQEGSFSGWIDRHGPWVMLVQLGILGIATVAAIATDGYWTGAQRPEPTPLGGTADEARSRRSPAAADGLPEEVPASTPSVSGESRP